MRLSGIPRSCRIDNDQFERRGHLSVAQQRSQAIPFGIELPRNDVQVGGVPGVALLAAQAARPADRTGAVTRGRIPCKDKPL